MVLHRSAAKWITDTRSIGVDTEPPITSKRVVLCSIGEYKFEPLCTGIQGTIIGQYGRVIDLRTDFPYIDSQHSPPHLDGTSEATIQAVYRLPGFVNMCQQVIEELICQNTIAVFLISDHGAGRAEVQALRGKTVRDIRVG